MYAFEFHIQGISILHISYMFAYSEM